MTTGIAGMPHLKVLRVHQWLKNLLVFLPMLAAHRLDGATLHKTGLAFLAFSLIASAVYVLNDRLDIEADRAHPRKRGRPFASGALPLSQAPWLIGVLLLAGTALAMALGTPFMLVLLIYFLTTCLYSFAFKKKPVLDICLLAGLYASRIIAGGVATGIPLSVWLVAFAMFFFLSLAALKRQAELVDGVAAGMVTAQGRGYHVDDLPLVQTMALASGYVSVLVFALWLNSATAGALYSQPALLWGICPVLLYWISRTAMMAHRGQMHDDPVVFAVRDRTSQFCGLVVVALALAGALL